MNFEHLKTRKEESLADLLVPTEVLQGPISIIGTSSDVGVILNGGRWGARFASTCLINQLKKFAKHSSEQIHYKVLNFQTSEEENSMALNQIMSGPFANSVAPTVKNLIHLGSGHDHIYHLVHYYKKLNKKILCLNLDAHADTRQDPFLHSGTPFRLLANELKDQFELIEFGLLKMANTTSTLSPVNSKTEYIFKDQTQKSWNQIKEKLKTIDQDTIFILSLDSDVLSSSHMKAVSAVNPHGLDLELIYEILQFYKNEIPSEYKAFGIYEFNPLYDDLSNQGARTLCGFIYEILN